MFITKKHMPRRTVLCGMGVTVALPLLDSMLPAMTPARLTEAGRPITRLACIEMVHGAAGCARYGAEKNMWTPAQSGHDFDLSPTSMLPLDPWKEYLTIVSNTDMITADAWTLPEVGGDHFRCTAVYLTQSHPKQTEGSDVYCGTSFDQLYAQKFGQDTALPSIQLSIEPVDQAGGCNYGYSCAYTDSISWAAADKPLPMIRDPRMVFDQLFGAGATADERAARRQADRSILDWLTREAARVKSNLDPLDRSRLDEHLETIREIERRIQKVEQRNASGETRELPTAPFGVPDSFEEHTKLMFDLQAVAFAGDVTRVSSFKLSRDGVGRTYPESGVSAGFHGASHHGDNPQRITQFAMINRYHVSMVPYFLEKLKNMKEGDSNLLERSIVLYGSPMGDPNVHNHRRVPIFMVGRGNGVLKGHVHIMAKDATPSANMFLTLLQRLGIEMDHFGDSTGELAL
jgi:hypothetical protein